jgi:hypothetical protein
VPTRREVFYAAYGSNLSAARFACYIAGGVAPGSGHVHRGARDTRVPDVWRARRVPGRLYFSGHAASWGGAPAFFDPDVGVARVGDEGPGHEVLVRAWRLGWDQFEDLVAQENGRPITGALEIDSDDLVEGFSCLAGPGRYDRLVCLGTLEGVPVLTCTAPWALESVAPLPPSPAYLGHLVAGLRESFDLDDPAIVDYLGRAPGATPELVRSALRR